MPEVRGIRLRTRSRQAFTDSLYLYPLGYGPVEIVQVELDTTEETDCYDCGLSEDVIRTNITEINRT